jgi:hypothetical protein
LLQNADDANATEVKIHYMTDSKSPVPLSDLTSTPCSKLLVSNNGIHFRQEDWSRLKRIAEGNPDPEKIGAFGVGFYSVFSITESPLVLSGWESMQFSWQENQLYVQKGRLQKEKLTTFILQVRTPTKIPDLVYYPSHYFINQSPICVDFWQRR